MRRLVATALVAGLAALPSPAAARDADRGTASWRGLGVPYVQVHDARDRHGKVRLRFQRTRVDYWENFRGGVFSVTSTADSAIAFTWRHGGEGKDLEGPMFEVSADGTTGRVERRALGIPMADPRGHTAFWSKRDGRRTRLVGYDTRTHRKVRGPLLPRGSRVFAVEGDIAYVMTFRGPAPTVSWAPGDTSVTPFRLPPASDPDEGRLLADVHEGRFLSVDSGDGSVQWSDADGNVLGSLTNAGLGALSADARFLATVGGRRVFVTDLGSDTLVDLRLPRRLKGVAFQWTTDNLLVVTATPRGAYDDANAAFRFLCSPPEPACRRLPGRSALYYEPLVESSSWGQLLTLLTPVGSRASSRAPKAPGPHLRQN